MKFAKFMSSNLGRLLRIIVGIVLIVIGFQMGSAGGYVLAVFGLVALATGVLDLCLIAPFLHMPFAGKAIRAFKIKP